MMGVSPFALSRLAAGRTFSDGKAKPSERLKALEPLHTGDNDKSAQYFLTPNKNHRKLWHRKL